jgi:N-acetylglucosaminyl-diphospho-decaprenol L-rhamnosyltransferase
MEADYNMKAGGPPVPVAIINYNTREHLRACLASVVPEHPPEVIVVDNASTDGSAEMVRHEFPEVTLIGRDDNPGYGAAANQAIAASSGDVVLLLNSDTRLLPGALSGVANYMGRHPRVGLVGPRLLNTDGTLQPSCFTWPGARKTLKAVGSGLASRIFKVRDRHWWTWSYDRPRNVPCVLGAALAIRRTAFEEVGGFDPAFFMYYEETDLCVRLWRAGWSVQFAPDAEVVHVGGVSTDQQRAAMYAQKCASMLQFLKKHDGRSVARRHAIALKALLQIRLLRDTTRLKLGGLGTERGNLLDAVERWRTALASI